MQFRMIFGVFPMCFIRRLQIAIDDFFYTLRPEAAEDEPFGEAGIHDALGAYWANLNGVLPVGMRPPDNFFPDCIRSYLHQGEG